VPLTVLSCDECGGHADFVSLVEAARLFEQPERELLDFVASNACHTVSDPSGVTHICLATFMRAMKARTGNLNLIVGET